MKVLFVSRYAEPISTGGNSNVYRQARSLCEDFGIDTEILTWPNHDLWTGPLPQELTPIPALQVHREGVTYHVFTAPSTWDASNGGNVVEPDTWEAAVAYGEKLLTLIRPDIVHLQHRHGLWWMLDSAQRLGIPTVYSNHDWGVACLRTVLVMGDDTLCDGNVAVDKCARCIVQGRGLVGRINEELVQTGVGRKVVNFLTQPAFERVISRRSMVRWPAHERAAINQERATRVVSNLKHLFTPSEFGCRLFTQLGLSPKQVTVLPWYHDPVHFEKSFPQEQPFTITYIGRISPEKGLHLVFEALKEVQEVGPIQFLIAGLTTSTYAAALQKEYPNQVGNATIKWLGWAAVEPLFSGSDVIIIPSVCMDNTPLSLIEALSYHVPVIATRIPPIEELVTEGHNAFLADYLSVASLADAIRRAVSQKEVIRSGRILFPPVKTLKEYMKVVVNTYQKIV